MTRIFYIIALFISLGLTSSYANLGVDVRLGDYLSGEDTYLEVSALIFGRSVQYGEDGRSVELTFIVKNDLKTFHMDRFNLTSPHQDSSDLDFGVMRRYALSPGDYLLNVYVQDNSDTSSHIYKELRFTIRDLASRPSLSTLTLAENISKAKGTEPDQKGGFILEPIGWSFTRSQLGDMYYYLEMYNTSEIPVVQISTKVISDEGMEYQATFKKKYGVPFKSIMGKVDLTTIPSGNYKLVADLYDGDQALDQVVYYFQHSNSEFIPELAEELESETSFMNLMSSEELDYAIKAAIPRTPSTDLNYINTVLREDDKRNKLAALKYQWSKLAPANTQAIYDEYMEIARAIDFEYNSGYGHGFETDRGFYYLKYGQPDQIYRNEQEFDAPPYEMWTYNKIEQTGQADVKFIFFNPSLSPGNYELLHSTALGEPNNPRWQTQLYQDVPNEREGSNHFDATQMRDGINRNAARRFNDF